jgi:uncharacterized membrane protein YfcA
MPFGFIGSKIGIWIGTKYQIMIFLLLLLIVFTFMFLRKHNFTEATKLHSNENLVSALIGAMIGMLTGIVGVGGGFFLVPAFLYAEHLSFQESAGTSLFVIFINSLSALVGYASTSSLPWGEMLSFGLFASIGMFAGNYYSKLIAQEKLRKVFAVSLILVFLFTASKEYFGFLG